MRRLFHKYVILLVALLFASGATIFAADVPSCLKHFVVEIVDDLGRVDARVLFKNVGKLTPEGQAGAQAVLLLRDGDNDGPERLLRILRNFKLYLPQHQVPNPFPNVDDLLGSVAANTKVGPDGLLVAPPGLRRAAGELGAEDAFGFTPQGAAFDFHMARVYGGYNGVAAFRVSVPVPGASGLVRVYDLGLGAPGTHFTVMILVENKGLVAPYSFSVGVRNAAGRFEYADERLTGLAQEFDRDILVHGDEGFERWRLNYRKALEGQRAEIEQVLLKQFESKIVTDFYGSRVGAVKTAFIQQLPTLLQFR